MIRKYLSNRKFKVVSLCIVIATTFWFFNAMNKHNYNTNIDYPINVIYNEDEYTPTGEVPTSVSINVEGSGWNILAASFGFGTSEYEFEIARLRGKFYVVGRDLTYFISTHIDHLKVNYVLQDTIQFNIEPKLTKNIKIAIAPQFVSEQYQFKYKPSISPSVIEVTGPQSTIEVLDSVIFLKDKELSFGNSLKEKNIELSNYLPLLAKSKTKNIVITAIVDEYITKGFETPLKIDSLDNTSVTIKGNFEILKEASDKELNSVVQFSLNRSKLDSIFIQCNYDERAIRKISYSPKRILQQKEPIQP